MRKYDIRETYMELEESMERLVRSRKDAFAIIWFDIHSWLEPEHSAMKADLCGILTEKVIGRNIAHAVHDPASDVSYYQEIQRKYAFGKSVGEFGEYWKELIREEHHFRLGVLLGCLDTYYNTIMPYVKNEMVAVGNEWMNGHPEMSLTLKPYREHRAKIKATIQIIQTASDIFTLQHMTETDCKEI